MMKPVILAAGLVSALAVLPAVAQNVQSSSSNSGLYELIDMSEGYFGIRENVVLIEGETAIKVCHFGLTPEFFAAYGAHDAVGIEATQPTVVCVPIENIKVVGAASPINSNTALYEFIDTSESYVRVGQGIVMIEGESDIEFCHFDLKDEYFAAVAAKDEAAMAAHQPSVTCVPFGDLN